MAGMIEGLFEFEILDFRIFLDRRILASIILLACEQQMYFWLPLLYPFAGYFFYGQLDLSRNVLGIQNYLKIRDSAHVSWRHKSPNKVKPNLFCDCFNV